jgi:hypothetical protein
MQMVNLVCHNRISGSAVSVAAHERRLFPCLFVFGSQCLEWIVTHEVSRKARSQWADSCANVTAKFSTPCGTTHQSLIICP